MKLSATVYMNRRDVTKWVDELTVRQAPRTLYREWSVTLRGWHAIEDGATWDIYASYDPTVPRSELLVRGGIVPPDRDPEATIARGQVPSVRVQGYDWAWLAQRIAPPCTVVIAPTHTKARVAVESYDDGPVGRYSVVRAATLHAALRQLAEAAGFNVDIRIPDYPISSYVFSPEQSLWDDIWELVEPFRPDVFFRRNRCEVVIADAINEFVGVGRLVNFSAKSVAEDSVSVHPRNLRHVSRVLIEVPPWL